MAFISTRVASESDVIAQPPQAIQGNVSGTTDDAEVCATKAGRPPTCRTKCVTAARKRPARAKVRRERQVPSYVKFTLVLLKAKLFLSRPALVSIGAVGPLALA